MEQPPSSPLLTAEQVREWLSEHATLRREVEHATSRLRAVEKRIAVLPLLLPADIVSQLLGDWQPTDGKADPDHANDTPPNPLRFGREPTAAMLVKEVLLGEKGGRPPAWFRQKFLSDPALRPRFEKSSASIMNAVSRMTAVGELIRVDGFYYLPEVYNAIKRGEVVEERYEAEDPSDSMNAILRRVMADLGGSGVAAQIVAKATEANALEGKTTDAAAAIYRWLSREVHKGRLFREGSTYHLEYPGSAPRNSLFADKADGGANVIGDGLG